MKCPICQKEMIKDWEKNIEVDVCLDHGMWLDKGELERVVNRSSKQVVFARESQLDEAYDEGKWQGIWFGLLAYFFRRR